MSPKVIDKANHQINREDIDPHAIEIILKLQQEGFEAYLVGGGVRDLLLGHKPKDFDISTAASPEEIKRTFRRSCILIGRRFRLAHIRFGKKVFEVSTFRSGDIASEELITRDNVWGNAEQDVMRRDFTMNGLFYCPKTEHIIDYVDGFHDIQKQHLRCIGQPHLRFKQDPVRMIRLLKFEARFGLNVDEELKIALLECRSEIIKSSSPRVLEEILRMLESGSSAKFIHLMSDHGLIQPLMSGLSKFLESSHSSIIYDYLGEIDYMIKEFSRVQIHRSILLGALTFPILHTLLLKKMEEKGHAPHLGIIQQLCFDVVHDTFEPFLILPRRLKIALINILFTQYRLIPLEKSKQRKKRIPNVPDLLLTMQFLNLRYRLDPSLKKDWNEWSKLFLGKKRGA
ncbi:MAG: polynucleotide adenylyltransferase PcnB [Chlamydiales bacterium]|nr:polynucleotide adenylyltransferase PcnB [Chlamydiales bacterium]